MEILIGAILSPPYVANCTDLNDRLLCPNPGWAVDFTRELCDIVQFNCTFMLANYTAYGDWIDNKWIGLLGDIDSGVYTTAVPLLTPTVQRRNYFTFSEPVFTFYSSFLFRGPTIDHAEANFFEMVFPFGWEVCMLVVTTVFAIGTISTLYEMKKPLEKRNNSSAKFWFSWLWDVSLYALDQGVEAMRFTKSATRVMFGFWALGALILLGLYSATVVSTLLDTRLRLPFTNFKTFVKCLEKKYCRIITSTTESSQYTSLNDSLWEWDHRLARTLRTNPPIEEPNVAKMLEMISEEKSIYLVAWGYNERLLEMIGHNCTYHIMSDSRQEDTGTFAFKTNAINSTSLLERFTNATRVAIQSGIMRKLEAQYLVPRHCEIARRDNMVQRHRFPVNSMFGLLIIVGIGSITAVIIFFAELVITKYNRSLIIKSVQYDAKHARIPTNEQHMQVKQGKKFSL